MTARRYHDVGDGEWFTLARTWYLRCCDCGLRHRVNMRMRDGRVQLRAYRLSKRRRSKDRS